MRFPRAVVDADVSARAARGRSRRWMLLACMVLVGGLGLSATAALLWRSSERRHEQETFQETAANVTASLRTLLRRDADFVATVRGVMTMKPQLSDTEFSNWYTALEGEQRQVGGAGTAIVSAVPASNLTAVLARRDADPTFRALFQTLLPVKRAGQSEYCILTAGADLIALDPNTKSLVQQDWCDLSSALGIYEGPLFRAERDTGQFGVLSVPALGRQTMMFLEAPFYRRGASLTSVAGRRAGAMGWVVGSFDINSLIRLAVASNPAMWVDVYHRNPGGAPELAGSAGTASGPGSLTRTTNVSIDGAWTVKVSGRRITGGFSPDQQALLVFVAGGVISLLLSLLVVVLARSRERALALVAEKTAQLRHLALHDALTGLPNRVLALDRADQMLARARRSGAPIAALYVDIDGFKQVNDRFGHPAGDEFLRTVAVRLRSLIRESDTAARLSGDEFLILLEAPTETISADLVAERLLDVLRAPFGIGEIGRHITTSASIGIAYGRDGPAEQLLADADVALYVAKSSGRDRYVIFESGMQSAAHDRLEVKMDLEEALNEEQLFLVYQPTFDLRSEQPAGVEALLRWRHPDRGVIAPGEFIPIAEESGLIIPIGRWVLEQACEQAARWRLGGHPLGVSVNVSARQLDDDGLVEDVRTALALSGLEPEALTLEMTETTLMKDADAAAERLGQLKELGVLIAIDDFGTGYSSLAYLREFSVDAVKIDMSFVRGIAVSAESAALVQTLIKLGKTLGLKTLAEGIESPEQLRALQREDCEEGQGFLFARPLDADAFVRFLDLGDAEIVEA